MKRSTQELLTLYENMSEKKYFQYFEIPYIDSHQFTYGKHSFGMDDKEIPAENPGDYITAEFIVDFSKLEEILLEYECKVVNVIYLRETYGTYHYCSLHGQAILEIQLAPNTDESQLKYDILQLNENELSDFKELTGSNYDTLTEIKRPFEGWYDVEDTWKDFMKGVKLQPITGSSKDYWDKKILVAHAQQKAWDKRHYDGD